MNDLNMRRRVVREARRWIGTPYLHQASVKSKGADCLGLVRGVWRHCLGEEPEKAPDYTPDWGEVSASETMLEAARRWFVPIPEEEALAGDLILFRWKRTGTIKHVGILTSPLRHSPRFIHAYEKAGVVETNLGAQWKKRVAACFRFPSHMTLEK